MKLNKRIAYWENERDKHLEDSQLRKSAEYVIQCLLALDEVLDITHNHGIGLSAITGQEDGTNRVVFTPDQLNRIGDLARQAIN